MMSDNLSKFYTHNTEKKEKKFHKIRLEDGISINILKTHGEKKIKKFFHIPNFEIYLVKVSQKFLYS